MPVRNIGISGIAVAFAGLAGWLIYAGIRDVDPVTGLGVLLRGENPPSRSPGEPYIGNARRPDADTGGFVGADVAAIAAGGPVPPSEIVSVGGIRVHRKIAPQIGQLLKDAKTAGISGVSGGGYRSSVEQAALRIKNGCTCQNSSKCCRVPTAPVGKSMHERGLAIDFTQHGVIIDKNDPLYGWLTSNAGRYGLKNLPSEEWHWSTDGT